MARGACSRCGNDRKIVTRRTGAPLCGSCWQAVKPPTICETCGRPTRTLRRSDSGAALCPRCHAAHTPPEQCGVCGVCGQVKRVHHRPGGSPICSGCYGRSRPPEACARRGIVARVVARRPEGPLCEACRIYEKTGRRCRCAAPFLVDRACLLCAAQRDGRADLAGAVRTRLVAGGPPARQRLRSSIAGRLLQAMLQGTIPVELSAVAGLEPERPAAAVHAELGLLDARDEPLAEVQHALDEAITSAHPDDAGTLAQFGRWVVLHDVAQRIARGTARLGTPKTARDKIRRVAQLLAHLRHDSVPLTELEQSWTDDWLAAHRSARPDLRVFLAWARQRGLAPHHVDVDPAQSTEVRAEIDDDHRQALLGRILTDDTIEPRDRVAGFLLVGLGQPLTRIVALTTNHVLNDPVRIRLGTVPLRMPPPIDDLVAALVAAAVANNQPWLFIGQRGHLSAARLSELLRDVGVSNAIAARNAAWAALAAETPPVILAEKLGTAASTADRWSNAVGSHRNLYAAMSFTMGPV